MSDQSEKAPKGFKYAMQRARKLINDAEKTDQLLHDAEKKAGAQSQRIKQVSTDLSNLFRLVSAWGKGHYRRVPVQTILLAIAGIIYFINPIDVIADYFPIVGYLDDVTVISFVVKSIRNDIQEFLTWEKHR